jgi:hypothetical protein
MALPSSNWQLSDAILDQGIQNTNFFNGRILNAGDLQTDQEANREQHEQLGLAVGAGVVRGLWVELLSNGSDGRPPLVSVSAGLAVNGNGQAVALPFDIKLALARETLPLPVDAGLFADCAPPSATTVPLQAGIYILVASPASGFSGQAPMQTFTDVTSATGCGSRYAVEGVRFRLVQLDINSLTRLSQATRDAIAKTGSGLLTQTDAASLSKLRNWVAHICFGTEEVAGFIVDPFARAGTGDPFGIPFGQSPYTAYGAVDALIANGTLTPGDVPLALLDWTLKGVQYLDRWSVRRRVVPRSISAEWPLPFSVRRRSEAEAVFLQFQEQLATVFKSTTLTDIALAALPAADYFRYLPPTSFIPTNGGGRRGFDIQQFLTGITYRPQVFIEGAKLQSMFERSLGYLPVDVGSGEMVWTYLLRQNIQTIDNSVSNPPQQYLILATGHMPFEGEARFDLNRWDYANFS